MTPEEAIGILEGEVKRSLIHYDKNSVEAIRLGIEALKSIKDLRLAGLLPHSYILLGETES